MHVVVVVVEYNSQDKRMCSFHSLRRKTEGQMARGMKAEQEGMEEEI